MALYTDSDKPDRRRLLPAAKRKQVDIVMHSPHVYELFFPTEDSFKRAKSRYEEWERRKKTRKRRKRAQ